MITCLSRLKSLAVLAIILFSFLSMLSFSATAQNENMKINTGDEYIIAPRHKVFTPSMKVFKQEDFYLITIVFDIANSNFIKKNELTIETIPDKKKVINETSLPPATIKHIHGENDSEIYRNKFTFNVKVKKGSPSEFVLKIKYQGCTDNGTCYLPGKELWHINLDDLEAREINTLPEVSNYEANLTKNNIIWSIISFFIFGLLLSFTPCVLPMLPILSSIIIGHKDNIDMEKAFKLSFVYVVSMAMTYSVAGMVSAILGGSLQQHLQTPLIIVGFSALLLVLAAFQFGIIKFQTKHSLTHFIEEQKLQPEEGTYWGVAIMGILATLIASPCVSVPLIGVLTYIAQTGNIQQGGIALFALGMGMGTPLLIIGTLGGKYIPKAGHWIHLIDKIFGMFLCGLALWVFSRIIPDTVTGAIWSIYITAIGIYWLYTNTHKHRVFKTVQFVIGGIITIYGLLIAGSYNNPNISPVDPLYTISTISDRTFYNNKPTTYKSIRSFEELKIELRSAAAQEKPVMLIFSARWCTVCSKIERYILAGPYVKQTLKDFVVIKADISDNSEATNRFMRIFDIVAPPVVIFFDSNGVKKRELTIIGDFDSNTLINRLSQVEKQS